MKKPLTFRAWIEETSLDTSEMQLLMLAKADASKFRKVVAKDGDTLHFKESYFHTVKGGAYEIFI